ncbi:50S ribosomal protein L9 [Candidatus Nomurabacteria bacterium]|nr:50S ribosomal protein L9 [Candidatus Nomurabacteria bacterium]
MKIILTKDVAKVGRAYEVKDLSDGFARNLIIARGLGLPATEENLKRLRKEKDQREMSSKVQTELLEGALEQLEGLVVKISVKASDTGHLFAGLHERDIRAALKEQTHLNLPEEMIILEEPIKTVGERVIKLKTGPIEGQFKLLIERLPS